jgi:hypothetical protein
MNSLTTRQRTVLVSTFAVTVLVEAVTIALRFGGGVNAAEFNAAAPPLLLQSHHMFWSIPLLVAVPFVWRWPRISSVLLGIGLGLILSDLAHHFIVLPLTVSNTGWHWP